MVSKVVAPVRAHIGGTETDDLLAWHGENVARIRAEFVARYGDSRRVIRVSDPEIIRAAWGPRRISSRRRGLDIPAYPVDVSAAYGLWLDWFDQAYDSVAIVIAKKRAQARIDAALGRVSGDPEMAESVPQRTISEDEIEDMLAEREALRAARQFADADKIRDYLVSQGVVVQDGKVPA